MASGGTQGAVTVYKTSSGDLKILQQINGVFTQEIGKARLTNLIITVSVNIILKLTLNLFCSETKKMEFLDYF